MSCRSSVPGRRCSIATPFSGRRSIGRNSRSPCKSSNVQVTLPFERRNWMDLDPDVHEARLKAFLQEDRARGFDLATPPLIRLTLISLAPDASQDRLPSTSFWMGGARRSCSAKLRSYAGARHGRPRLPDPRPFEEGHHVASATGLLGAECWRKALAGYKGPSSLPSSTRQADAPDAE